MFSLYTAPLVALVAALAVVEVQAGPIPHSGKGAGLAARHNHHDNGSSCWERGRRGHWQDDICLDLDLNLDVDIHKRSPSGPHRFTNYYADRTPCWVDGRRGWMKDHTCGDLINIEASIKVGKRFHNFDDPYFANGTPCFHNGRQGLLQDLLCAVIDVDVDVDAARYDHGYAGPWRFNRYYDEGRPCWVDTRRGYIHDQTCGNLIDIDADLSIGRRFYKDDPYFLNGVPCLENGKEGVLTNYQCIAAELHVQKRGYWGYYYQGENGLIDGAPCWQDGRQGVVGGLLCVVAEVHIGKRRLLGPPDGDSCYRYGRWGAMRAGECELLDVDADILVKRGILGSGQGDILGNILSSGPGHKGELLGDVLGVTGGDHGYSHGRQYAHGHEYGHYYEDELVDAAADIEVDDLAIKRGYYDPDELMAEIEAEAEINADGIIYGKRFYRYEGGDLDIAADLDVDVDAVHHGHRYHERSGLLNNQNGVKGAVDTIGKTTHNTLGKRNFGHGYEHHHEYDHGLDVDAKVDVDINSDHRPHGVIRSLLTGAHGGNMQPRPNSFGKSGRVKSLVSGLGNLVH